MSIDKPGDSGGNIKPTGGVVKPSGDSKPLPPWLKKRDSAAKQIAKEPLEIFKQAARQTSPYEYKRPLSGWPPKGQAKDTVSDQYQVSEEEREKINEKARKRMEELKVELEDVRRKQQLKDKQRLEAEKMAGERRRESQEQHEPLQEVPTKRPRGMFAGIMGRVKKLRRKTELRLPPTG